jgi:hypothetical protein
MDKVPGMMTPVSIAAPSPRSHIPRMNDRLRSIPVDTANGWVMDPPTASCLVKYGSRRGWTLVQKRDGDRIIVWRIA